MGGVCGVTEGDTAGGQVDRWTGQPSVGNVAGQFEGHLSTNTTQRGWTDTEILPLTLSHHHSRHNHHCHPPPRAHHTSTPAIVYSVCHQPSSLSSSHSWQLTAQSVSVSSFITSLCRPLHLDAWHRGLSPPHCPLPYPSLPPLLSSLPCHLFLSSPLCRPSQPVGRPLLPPPPPPLHPPPHPPTLSLLCPTTTLR